MPGTLFVVATPIGNLEDLTYRATRILKSVDLIAAEDTRRTAKLLAHYGIQRPMTSYREHNEAREAPRLVARLQAGESIALVSDAGTPGIADPGARLVRATLDAGLPVVPIPGASAVTTALSASGVDASEFVFMGFPPASGAARQRWLERLVAEHRPVVFFEAPHRIARSWADARRLIPNNRIIAFRELTKVHESLVNWNTKDESSVVERGEFVVVVERKDGRDQGGGDEFAVSDLEKGLKVAEALEAAGFDKAEAALLASSALDQHPKTFAKALKKHKIWVKRQTDGLP